MVVALSRCSHNIESYKETRIGIRIIVLGIRNMALSGHSPYRVPFSISGLQIPRSSTLKEGLFAVRKKIQSSPTSLDSTKYSTL